MALCTESADPAVAIGGGAEAISDFAADRAARVAVVGPGLLVPVRLSDLAPGVAGLRDDGEHLLAYLAGGVGCRLEMLAAVTPLHAIPNDHSPGVDEPGRAAHLGEHLVPHLYAEEGVGRVSVCLL